MPHTIVTNICEGVADCVDACPVACIHEGPSKNVKGTGQTHDPSFGESVALINWDTFKCIY